VVHWPLPARDIVALGRFPHGVTDPARMTAKDIDAVPRAMLAADVVEFADRRVTELSGGERSRVALARGLGGGAPVLAAGGGRGAGGGGRPRRGADRLARPAPPDRRHEEPAHRRRWRR